MCEYLDVEDRATLLHTSCNLLKYFPHTLQKRFPFAHNSQG